MVYGNCWIWALFFWARRPLRRRLVPIKSEVGWIPHMFVFDRDRARFYDMTRYRKKGDRWTLIRALPWLWWKGRIRCLRRLSGYQSVLVCGPIDLVCQG